MEEEEEEMKKKKTTVRSVPDGSDNKSCRSDLIFMFKESIIDMRLAPIYEA